MPVKIELMLSAYIRGCCQNENITSITKNNNFPRIVKLIANNLGEIIEIKMFKLPNHRMKNRILDTLHKSVVTVCMAVTAVSTVYLVYRGYHFYVNEKPLLHRQLKQELLEEGAHDRDKAKELSV